MEKLFCMGLGLGMVGGALIVANSYKMRAFVKKSQADVMEKVNAMIDEKLNEDAHCQTQEMEKRAKK